MTCRASLALTLSIASCLTPLSADIRVTPVVVHGDQAPGRFDQFVNFWRIVINQKGQLGLSGRTLGRGDTFNGIWIIDPDLGPIEVALDGEVPPGFGSAFRIFGVSTFLLNDSGAMAWSAFLEGPGLEKRTQQALFFRTADGVQRIVAAPRTRLPIPASSTSVIGIHTYALNESEHIVFGAFTEHGEGIWIDRGGRPELVALEGQVALGIPGAPVLTEARDPSIDSSGRVSFFAEYRHPDSNERGQALWTGPIDDLRVVVQTGEDSGLGDGSVFESLTDLLVTPEGKMTFSAVLIDKSGERSTALWFRDLEGEIHLVMSSGARPLPGLPDAYVNPGGGKWLGDNALVGFNARVEGLSNRERWTTWIGSPDGAQFLSRYGDPAPGLPVGSQIDLLRPSFNRLDQMTVGGTYFNEEERDLTAVWFAASPEADLELLLAHGQSILIDEGDSRVVDEIGFLFNLDLERGRAINDRGEIAVTVKFMDTTEAVVLITREPGYHLPGDLNQDSTVSIADVSRVLDYLFRDPNEFVPCANPDSTDQVFDVNQDGKVNLSDPIHLAVHLFQSGPPPVAGSECIEVPDCSTSLICEP